ncbi:hypothetical protein SCHPADRAFT_905667 [Schizopora paradoxa]|uniref:Zn(2)-C6 fungal-type domain-containing protein n=1 Tax=Schizopora paradoxa TaxID=27342 RepID=A0A0H2RR25_9AGAM|nr:hypothetical protein SCHPADRAFT_905667 [Schizopora paradoxa]
MSEFSNNSESGPYQPASAPLAQIAGVVVEAVRVIQAIDSRIIEDLRALAASGEEESPIGRLRTRETEPCGTCSKRKVKCSKLPGNPNLCKKCEGLGMMECPAYEKWVARRPRAMKSAPQPY